MQLTAVIVPLLSILFVLMYIPQNNPMMVNANAQNNEEMAVAINNGVLPTLSVIMIIAFVCTISICNRLLFYMVLGFSLLINKINAGRL